MRRPGAWFALLLLAAQPAWAAGVDAIAIDEVGRGGNGDYAVGSGSTDAEARRIALSNCTLGGNVACRVVLSFRQCGAFAAAGRRSGTGTGGTEAAAAAAALASCGPQCRLVVADCAGAPLRPPPTQP